MRREKELRCFCSRHPLLATYGIDKVGRLYVHVKIWKAKRVFGELVIEGGLVKMRCRECLRWHQIHITQNRATLRENDTELPEAIIDQQR